jgi:hypothetical protein
MGLPNWSRNAGTRKGAAKDAAAKRNLARAQSMERRARAGSKRHSRRRRDYFWAVFHSRSSANMPTP